MAFIQVFLLYIVGLCEHVLLLAEVSVSIDMAA